MSEADDKTMQRLQRLLAMARDERGNAQERETAQRRLESMLAKAGMTLGDLTGDSEPEWFEFTAANAAEEQLLVNIACTVMGVKIVKCRRVGRRNGRRKLLLMSRQEWAASSVMYAVLRRALKKHIERARLAFLVANGLTDKAGEDDKPPAKPADPEEVKALLAMIRSTRPTPVHQALQHKP